MYVMLWMRWMCFSSGGGGVPRGGVIHLRTAVVAAGRAQAGHAAGDADRQLRCAAQRAALTQRLLQVVIHHALLIVWVGRACRVAPRSLKAVRANATGG